MAKPFTAFLLVTAGTTMNALRTMQRGRSPMSVLLGGIVFGTICVGLNDITKKDLGTMVAAIFLLSSALTSGVNLIDSLASAAESYE